MSGAALAEAPQTQCLSGRLGDLQVSCRSDLTFSRHVNRDGVCYIVHHPVTFQNHRLSVEDYFVFTQVSQKRTLSETFVALVALEALESDQEEDFYNFVVHLNQMHLLHLPISDGNQLYQRFTERNKQQRKQTMKSFLFFRIPLFQPDSFLDRTINRVGVMFSRPVVAIWFGLLALSLYLVAAHWEEFSDPLATMLAVSNFPVLWTLLLGLKVVHEFGHAYACKKYGGSVPEMGAFFLMGSPCAYMDASASWNFTSALHRFVVAMAGIYFETWIAFGAVFVWCMTEPGFVHSVALYLVVLSTVVTVGFNINPLMKYDGYFALSDFLGRPMLREDASHEFERLVKRTLFGLEIESQVDGYGERFALIGFGLACSVWRLLIAVGIASTLGQIVPMLGPLILFGYLGSTLLKMGKSAVQYLRESPEIEHCRRRAWITSGTIAIGCVVICALLPMPGAMQTRGVVIPENRQLLFASTPGFIKATTVANGHSIGTGEVICVLENEELRTQIDRTEQSVRGLELQIIEEIRLGDPVAAVTRQRLDQARQGLGDLEKQIAGLTLLAPAAGVVSEGDMLNRPGTYVTPGRPVAAIGSGDWMVTAVMDNETFSDLRPTSGQSVRIKFARDGAEVAGRIAGIERLASNRIEREELTQLAGGDIPVTPEESLAEKPYISIRIALDKQPEQLREGMTAFVNLGSYRPTFATVCLRGIQRLVARLRVD